MDASNDLIVATVRTTGNAIEVYQGGTNGSNSPIRTISGAQTGLGSDVAGCCHLSVTFSPYTGRIYVAVSAGTSTHISVFAGTANGDVSPIRTIQGPATGLAGNVITGIADSQITGNIYVMVKPSQFSGPAHIAEFGRYANNNTAPIRTFTDRSTGFADAAGIALGAG